MTEYLNGMTMNEFKSLNFRIFRETSTTVRHRMLIAIKRCQTLKVSLLMLQRLCREFGFVTEVTMTQI